MNNTLTELIYIVRGHKVMFDHDLANLYGVTTKVLTQAVKRNIERFPEDFAFSLSFQELTNLKSQFVTSSWGGRRKSPMVFTEQGVAMLSSVLRSPQAVQVNIGIMRAFVQLRNIISTNSELKKRLDSLEQKYDGQFKVVFEAIREIMSPTIPSKKRRIGF